MEGLCQYRKILQHNLCQLPQLMEIPLHFLQRYANSLLGLKRTLIMPQGKIKLNLEVGKFP